MRVPLRARQAAQATPALTPPTVWSGKSADSCGSFEGRNSGDAFTDDQLMDVVSAFVGDHGFEIVHVAHDGVVVHDTVGAEDLARHASGFQRHPDIIHL